VAIKDLAIVEAVQPRGRMNRDAVKAYERLYRFAPQGRLPPITVGRLPGRRKLVLIDGFHRVEAAKQANLTHLPAHVYDTDEAGAFWLAASENLKHGLQLKASDRREVFKRFVRAGRNRKADGDLMSSRELSSTLGLGSHASMLTWMKQDFPKIAAEMTGRDPDEVEEPGSGKDREDDQLIANVHWAEMQFLKSVTKALKSVDRDRLIAEVGNIAKKLEEALALPTGGLEATLQAIEEQDLNLDF